MPFTSLLCFLALSLNGTPTKVNPLPIRLVQAMKATPFRATLVVDGAEAWEGGQGKLNSPAATAADLSYRLGVPSTADGSKPLPSRVISALLDLSSRLEEADEAAKAQIRNQWATNGTQDRYYRTGSFEIGSSRLTWIFNLEDASGAVFETPAGVAVPAQILDLSLKELSSLPLEKGAASFDPMHLSGPYAGVKQCPVCEYGMAPMVFLWAQNDDESNLLQLQRTLESGSLKAGKEKVKIFVVVSNLDGKGQALGQALVQKAKTPDVWVTVIEDPNTGHLRKYRINRNSRNTIYFVKNRRVKVRYTDVAAGSAEAKKLSSDVINLAKD